MRLDGSASDRVREMVETVLVRRGHVILSIGKREEAVFPDPILPAWSTLLDERGNDELIRIYRGGNTINCGSKASDSL